MHSVSNAVTLACPNCARAGTAIWVVSERGSPPLLENLSVGFLSIDVGAKDGPRIVCRDCRVQARQSATG